MLKNIFARARLTVDQAAHYVRGALASEVASAGQSEIACLEERVLLSASPIAEIVVDAQAQQTDSGGVELVIIDQTVDDYESLARDFASNDNVIVETLDPNVNGIDQISALLEKYDQLDALHIVSHGTAGQVALGNTILDSNSLDGYASQIALWSNSLSQDADILIYGCDVAGSEDGKQLVEELAELTDADVAGSTNLTGHSSLGGDWYFEYQVGVIDTVAAASTQIQTNWNGTLQLAGTGEIQVNQNSPVDVDNNEETTRTGRRGSDSAVGIADDGSYVVVWSGDTGNGPGQTGEEVFFQRFDRFGQAIGDAERVNQTTTGQQDDASVAVNRDGSFVVVWENGFDGNVYMRHFDADGVPVANSENPTGGERRIAGAQATGNEGSPDIAINDAGQFVIVWEGPNPITGDLQGVLARTFNADGTPNSGVFQANLVGDFEDDPAVGIDLSLIHI